MRHRLRILTDALYDFASRTTHHGLLHIFLSNCRVRRAFWLLLLLAGLSLGLFHTAKTVQKFNERSVTSQIKLKSQEAVFPDITICNMNPVSVSVFLNTPLRNEFFIYVDEFWSHWLNWFLEEKVQRQDEILSDYRERFRRICGRLLQVLWVSADTRDISHLDKTMLLQCSFNGVPCNHKNFSLVQTNEYWNCYTFHPDPQLVSRGTGGRGAELEMVLFTDGYYRYEATNPAYIKSLLYDPLSIFWNRPKKKKYYLCLPEELTDQYPISPMLEAENQHESRGVRIFIHESRKYPLQSTEFVDVASASNANIQLRPIRNRLLRTQRSRCTEPPLEKARYVRHFAHASHNVVTKEFTKSVADFVVEEKQKLIQKHCGCYSHKYPFQVNTSQLCYYVPPEHWVTPSKSMLRNIQCHDEWFKKAEQPSSELKKEFRHRRWCDYWRFRPWQQSSSWPPFEVLNDIWDDLMVPQIKDGVEFLPSDGRKHHIFNVTRNSDLPNVTREVRSFLISKATINPYCWTMVFCKDKGCGEFKDMDDYFKLLRSIRKCIDPNSLAQNVAAVRIGLQSPAADLYEEADEFHWTEALSEIGGTMGLWLGISVLSALELLELLYVLVDVCVRGRRPAERPEAPEELGG